jgi:hypothetical protein
MSALERNVTAGSLIFLRDPPAIGFFLTSVRAQLLPPEAQRLQNHRREDMVFIIIAATVISAIAVVVGCVAFAFGAATVVKRGRVSVPLEETPLLFDRLTTFTRVDDPPSHAVPSGERMSAGPAALEFDDPESPNAKGLPMLTFTVFAVAGAVAVALAIITPASTVQVLLDCFFLVSPEAAAQSAAVTDPVPDAQQD